MKNQQDKVAIDYDWSIQYDDGELPVDKDRCRKKISEKLKYLFEGDDCNLEFEFSNRTFMVQAYPKKIKWKLNYELWIIRMFVSMEEQDLFKVSFWNRKDKNYFMLNELSNYKILYGLEFTPLIYVLELGVNDAFHIFTTENLRENIQ